MDNRKEIPDFMDENELIAALYKKALGYVSKEVTEEYGITEEQDCILNKKKVIIKQIPPDTLSAKLLFDQFKFDTECRYSLLTNEELEEERKKLLGLLQ